MTSADDDSPASCSLGEQELDVLRYVTDNAPTTARIAADEWSQPRGLAKSTVLTVLERLRAKGYLTRTKRYGSFEYSPSVPKSVLLRRLVREFVERTLGGSPVPLVQYLAETRDLTPAELALLEGFAQETEEIDSKRKAAGSVDSGSEAPETRAVTAGDHSTGDKTE